ncbi:hypothetical protein M3Y94_00002300 [Aphelenchoides besseyi]|nr:hypothetical protein M3Y94_00002300 [Aphelenchoides besseyi]KAI6220789.1 hypothetical protein M3Y95_01033400 [Aphelenchoides besseyi]
MDDTSFCSDFAFDLNVTQRSSKQKRAHPSSQRSQSRSQDSLRGKASLNTTQANFSFGIDSSDSDVSTTSIGNLHAPATSHLKQQPRARNKSQAPNLPMISAEEVLQKILRLHTKSVELRNQMPVGALELMAKTTEAVNHVMKEDEFIAELDNNLVARMNKFDEEKKEFKKLVEEAKAMIKKVENEKDDPDGLFSCFDEIELNCVEERELEREMELNGEIDYDYSQPFSHVDF